MTRASLFDHPFLLGFEDLERMLERMGRSAAEGYPPYNVLKRGESGLRITLAVAGFEAEDLSVALEDRELKIEGRQSGAPEEQTVFLHRGIAARSFKRSFVLADGLEVEAATLENGLLHIDLVRPKPTIEARTIKIKTGAG